MAKPFQRLREALPIEVRERAAARTQDMLSEVEKQLTIARQIAIERRGVLRALAGTDGIADKPLDGEKSLGIIGDTQPPA